MSTSFSIVSQTGVPIPAAIACSWKLALAGGAFSALGDAYPPEREGGKITLETDALPHGYTGLLQWYQEWRQTLARAEVNQDGIPGLRGSGKELWADEHADDYVRRLREGWE